VNRGYSYTTINNVYKVVPMVTMKTHPIIPVCNAIPIVAIVTEALKYSARPAKIINIYIKAIALTNVMLDFILTVITNVYHVVNKIVRNALL